MCWAHEVFDIANVTIYIAQQLCVICEISQQIWEVSGRRRWQVLMRNLIQHQNHFICGGKWCSTYAFNMVKNFDDPVISCEELRNTISRILGNFKSLFQKSQVSSLNKRFEKMFAHIFPDVKSDRLWLHEGRAGADWDPFGPQGKNT